MDGLEKSSGNTGSAGAFEGLSDKHRISGVIITEEFRKVHGHRGILNRFYSSVFVANIDFPVKVLPDAKNLLGKFPCFEW
jgi:hypothetical protein